MTRTTLAAVFWALSAVGALASPAGPEFDADTGYRINRYQAPLPEAVPGGQRVEFEDVSRFVRERSAILIDVMPTDGTGADPATGRWIIRVPHKNIPGSNWLPDVGRGHIDEGLDHYFRENLERLTGGDKNRALLIYCQADCWMGWNAVKRAASYGYTKIYWYPEGRDGWRDWDGTIVPASPVPMSPGDAQRRHQLPSAPAH